MSYKKKRTDYNNKWPSETIIFSGQQEYLNLLNEKGITHILKPIQLPVIDDFHFQRLLSFKIDIYEQLPNRPDIAFDLAWRTFEAYSSYIAFMGGWSTIKTWKILNKTIEDIFVNQLNNNLKLDCAFKNLLACVPLQATEFLVKRILEISEASIKPQQGQIIERVIDALGEDFYTSFKENYGANTPDIQRKAGMFLQLLVQGKKVKLNDKFYTLDTKGVLKLLINGLLYTYRNERFHGGAFSPFKSSKTQIKTYAHAYYCLIATYFFISQLIFHHYPSLFSMDSIAESLEDNTTRYDLVFSQHRKK